MKTAGAVRFAILGFGHHAIKRLVMAFAASNETELVGLWRRDAGQAAKNCAEFRVPLNFTSREELCASPEVDAVFITSPDAMHLEDTLLAVSHGKAVLCEKPLAMTADEALRMQAAATQHGVLLGVAQNLRWSPSVVWMREQIAAGRIGEPQLGRAQFCYKALGTPRRWITNGGLACGGPIGDVGVHCLDALRFVCDREVLRVQTMARKDETFGDLEAVATIQAEMSGGCFASVSVSALAPYRTQIEVVGSEGVIVAENGMSVDHPVTVEIWVGGELVQAETFDNSTSYTGMLDSFAKAMRGETFRASAQDGVATMRLLDAVYRGWGSGRTES
jgi:1,5-anhydro-D-fructose reductase (1,5-anhydro-D-mannitol-forming)